PSMPRAALERETEIGAEAQRLITPARARLVLQAPGFSAIRHLATRPACSALTGIRIFIASTTAVSVSASMHSRVFTGQLSSCPATGDVVWRVMGGPLRECSRPHSRMPWRPLQAQAPVNARGSLVRLPRAMQIEA